MIFESLWPWSYYSRPFFLGGGLLVAANPRKIRDRVAKHRGAVIEVKKLLHTLRDRQGH